MSTQAGTFSLTVQGLEQALVVLPYQLGFRPQRSLVLWSLGSASAAHGASGVRQLDVVLTARVDLPRRNEHARLLTAIDPVLKDARVTHLVAAVIDEQAIESIDEFNLPGLWHDIDAAARTNGLEVVTRARVCGRRWCVVDQADLAAAARWASLPPDREVPVVADYVLQGRAPRAHRRSLEQVLTPASRRLRERVRAELSGSVLTRVPGHSTGPRPRDVAVLGHIIGASGDVPPPLSAPDVARCAQALFDIPTRDAVLARLAPSLAGARDRCDDLGRAMDQHIPVDACLDRQMCHRLASAASYVPAQWAAPWWALVGYLAWSVGDGALANIVTAAALECDPDYSLAKLVDLALQGAAPPPSR